MNYYRRYVGDYLRDTATLSLLEHGAYSILLDYYYAEERPIPLDLDEVYRMCRAITPEERRAVVKVLTKYFTRQDDGHHNARADKEIAVSRQARDNGGKGGRPPKTGPGTGNDTGGGTDLETGSKTGSGTGKGGGSGHPPTTSLQPPPASRQSRSAAAAAPAGFEEAWQAYPKRSGNQPKAKAERAYRARLAEGAAPEAILAGVRRYAAFCRATGKIGSEYVLQAKTFFGPDKPFLQPWVVANGGGEWWKSDQATLDKGKECGVPTRPGESMNEYRERIREKLARPEA